MAVFLSLGVTGCPLTEDTLHNYTPNSATAWTPIKLDFTEDSWGHTYEGSWKIKNAGTTRAVIKDNLLFTMAPGTITLTLTFKNSGYWNKDVVKDFTIRIDPAPEEIHALGTELVAHGVNTADNPVSLKANIDMEAHWKDLLIMLVVADRYVNIDFINSTGMEINGSGLTFDYGIYYYSRYCYPKLLSVVLPNSIISIGKEAFSSCPSLTSVIIPDSVASIGNSAFSGCSSLAGITIPDSVTNIGNSAFSGCTSLTSITIGNNVTSIMHSIFNGCSNLETINVNSGNTTYSSIDGIVYDKTAETLILCPEGKSGTVNIPGSVASIGNAAFYACSRLTSITIPDSVTSIGNSAFSDCSSLTSITIPDSVANIGNSAFSGCSSLTSITIPESVASIGEQAFYRCTSLASVTMGNNVTSIGKSAFSDCSSLANIIIPDSVTSIEERAFNGCTILTSVTIGNNVAIIGNSVFRNCASLETINVNSDNTTYSSIDGIVYDKTTDALILCPEGKTGTVNIPGGVTGIGYSAFYQCGKIIGIIIPNSVTSIGEYAINSCTSLASVNIPNGVTTIGYAAFHGCTSLTSITIPNSVTSIGDSAFKNNGLVSVTFEGAIAKTGFNDDAFNGDLRFKYFATNGGPGTYIRQSETRWSKR